MKNNRYEKEHYQAPAPGPHSSFWNGNIGTVLINQYKSQMIGRIADFGCNNGTWASRISLLDTVEKIVGFDINEDAVNLAIEKVLPQIPETKGKLSFQVTNLTCIDHEENFFDFAYSFHTLEHVYPEDVDLVISQMRKLLKPSGLLLINMPDKDSYPHEALHVYKPSLDDLNNLMQKHGFDMIESFIDERGGQSGSSKNITGLYKKV